MGEKVYNVLHVLPLCLFHLTCRIMFISTKTLPTASLAFSVKSLIASYRQTSTTMESPPPGFK